MATNIRSRRCEAADSIIRVAAALIDDDAGRLLLVRKAGTPWFMQAGGKIDCDETPLAALRRELSEEIGVVLIEAETRYLGTFVAPAANEPNYSVEAEVFHLRLRHSPEPQSEIAEVVWATQAEAVAMPLAPLSRDHILPLARIVHRSKSTIVPNGFSDEHIADIEARRPAR